MKKRVLDVGNCAMDHAAIRSVLESRHRAEVVQAHDWEDMRRHLEQESFDLVLVNRILDRDGGQGIELIRRLKSEDQWSRLPVMMITNFPDHQRLAVEAGAEPGFGKQRLNDSETESLLGRFLK